MFTLGTFAPPASARATRVLLLGSGELGKEVAIELQRLGCEVIACDRYAGAPAMQVAHRSHVFSMLDGAELRRVITLEKPDLVVPEIEAIATEVLVELEAAGQRVVPTARAARLTMNREGIRRLVAEDLKMPTSPYRFVGTAEEASAAGAQLGYPCVLKPLMSSSGHGQSVVKTAADMAAAWTYAQEGARAGAGRCIVEGFIRFDYEITVLTVAASNGIQCCPAVGHVQIDGDYRESWQPCAMSQKAWEQAQIIAKSVVANLGGWGLFGVECFVCGDEVIFSEVSPRPHDTGLVTIGSQQLSEFALHARAILGLPVPPVVLLRPAHSVALLGHGEGVPVISGVAEALAVPESQIRLFGKPECRGHRRLGVAVATGNTSEEARERARAMAAAITITVG
ncbi:MAG: formate-dependent phosphoribosylglycinamide formyltransferase [Opitutus sp.]|nr:formate-dependent phosphoribosylglycinamide formyltransferase [Opitutus sp.]MCS6275182.1 formate-dependent phosphoribosylglycinamide formyltransferase [Opitutus sp.]MCS6277876.1 formate-dependent phosphoribosylglycinamide formyltransferase [Opitutus sp.]MCS6299017.1 formate-dependent phosphoribosylglycinamide formyltransferase [Opitutus sp.]